VLARCSVFHVSLLDNWLAARHGLVGWRFEILGEIIDIQTIAISVGIREIARLRKQYGRGRWRKRKGIARIRLANSRIRLAELHWYEAHGIGRMEIKRKRYLSES
jgi:hypothetical protein